MNKLIIHDKKNSKIDRILLDVVCWALTTATKAAKAKRATNFMLIKLGRRSKIQVVTDDCLVNPSGIYTEL